MLRIALLPFVYVGWLLAQFPKFGGSMSVASAWPGFMYVMPGIASIVCMLFLIISIAMLFEPGWLASAIFVATLSLLGFIGFIRGGVLAVRGTRWKSLAKRHMNLPMRAMPMLAALLIASTVMLVFALQGLLTGRAPVGR
jgi:hypothetical protein